MNYWVCSTTSDSFEVVKAKNIWAVRDGIGGKWSVKAIKIDDVIVFYVKKAKQFQGVYKVVSPWYRTQEIVWPEEKAQGKKTAPNEIAVQPIAIGNFNVKDLIDRLEFIKKKDYRWGVYLLGAPANFRRPIAKEDYESILDAVKRSESKKVSVTLPTGGLHDQLAMAMYSLGEILGYKSEKGVQLYKINPRTPPEQRNRSVDVIWKTGETYSQCIPIEVQTHGSPDAIIRRLKLLEPRALKMIVVGSEQDLKSIKSDVEYSESRAFAEKLVYVPQEKVLKARDHIPAIRDILEFLKPRE